VQVQVQVAGRVWQCAVQVRVVVAVCRVWQVCGVQAGGAGVEQRCSSRRGRQWQEWRSGGEYARGVRCVQVRQSGSSGRCRQVAGEAQAVRQAVRWQAVRQGSRQAAGAAEGRVAGKEVQAGGSSGGRWQSVQAG